MSRTLSRVEIALLLATGWPWQLAALGPGVLQKSHSHRVAVWSAHSGPAALACCPYCPGSKLTCSSKSSATVVSRQHAAILTSNCLLPCPPFCTFSRAFPQHTHQQHACAPPQTPCTPKSTRRPTQLPHPSTHSQPPHSHPPSAMHTHMRAGIHHNGQHVSVLVDVHSKVAGVLCRKGAVLQQGWWVRGSRGGNEGVCVWGGGCGWDGACVVVGVGRGETRVVCCSPGVFPAAHTPLASNIPHCCVVDAVLDPRAKATLHTPSHLATQPDAPASQ